MKRLGVLGWPVAHSRSPAMQNAALHALGLRDWHYQRLPAPPEVFADTVAGLPAAGFVGANVTIPHKEAALALADEATAAARAIGAANTLTFTTDGAIHAENTDAPGFLAALEDANPDAARGTALVLGAGGSARGIAYALREAGARRVTVWNRTHDRALALAADLGIDAAQTPVPADLLVNCTSVGLTDGEFKELPLDADALGTYATVADLVYRTGGTGLVAEARRRGCSVVDGLEMLVRQGAISLAAWTGREAPIDVMRAAVAARDANPDALDPGTSHPSDRRAADDRRTGR